MGHPKVEQRKQAREAKRAANRQKRLQDRARRSGGVTPTRESKGPIVTNVMILSEQGRADKSAAYEALRNSKTLCNHRWQYRHHEPRQLAVMRGELTIWKLPLQIAIEVCHELSPYWQRKEGA